MSPSTRLLARCNHPHQGTSFYTSAQWTADGTTVLTSSSDQVISAFALPDDLLSGEQTTLQAQGQVTLPEPSQIIAPAPYFSLQEPTTQHFLAGCRDHPLQLYNCFPNDEACAPIRGYKLIKHETEAYITPSSVLWQYPGTHFVVGSTNRLDLFDITGHSSDGPVTTVATIPSKRHIRKGNGIGMKGTVSALSSSAAGAEGGIIAAGTRTRWVGMYDLSRSEKTVANWSIAAAADEGGVPGQGIVQTIWSHCGRYLLVNERNAPGLLVYDVRVTGQLLSILKGRRANTQQKLNVDVFPGGEDGGFEVWAGGDDGRVSVWEGVGLHGDFDAKETWGWRAHDAPMGSVALHSSGSVVATCSGGWEYATKNDEDAGDEGKGNILQTDGSTILDDSALRLWSIAASQADESTDLDTEAQGLPIHGTTHK
ncbi:WD repeat-containing protein 79 [Emericellopsis atlantica]|uniref:WD repeat-containing protein 79 n=1 Tax=Emericellopsis atlantica TaxID=2614577 RepID=A0A9P7ZVR4_9HYPO|nr:WD repeat-containing protein 79 [Emericellopsis atlantica]KAG9259135.1 WD repeat-containing protein 79 [Emericellopsis atlantica]